MSIEKSITRNYKFSDGVLKQKADGVLVNMERDAAAFTARGIVQARRDAFQLLINNFDEAPYDEEALGDQTSATASKDAKAEELKISIRSVRTIVENTFGTKSSNYKTYRFERLNKTPEDILHRLARCVVNVATKQLVQFPALGDEGLTAAMIDQVRTLDGEFDLLIDGQLDATNDREIKAEERIIHGNGVHKEMMKLCNIAKDIFASTDPARYNDYIIYNTPNALPPAPGITGRMHGSATNSANGSPIEGVAIYYPDVALPVETDSEGMYSNNLVDKNAMTFTAIHPNFQNFTGNYVIIADQEIVYNFVMTPKI